MGKWILSSVLCAALAFACGGGKGGGGSSGVSGSKQIIDLDAAERSQVCEFLADVLGPERTVDCGGGETRGVGGEASECVAEFTSLAMNAPGCTITVGQYETCIEALANLSDAQICADDFPAACAPLLASECLGE